MRERSRSSRWQLEPGNDSKRPRKRESRKGTTHWRILLHLSITSVLNSTPEVSYSVPQFDWRLLRRSPQPDRGARRVSHSLFMRLLLTSWLAHSRGISLFFSPWRVHR